MIWLGPVGPSAEDRARWDLLVAGGHYDEAERLQPGSTWLAGVVSHAAVVESLPASIRADFCDEGDVVDHEWHSWIEMEGIGRRRPRLFPPAPERERK